MDKTLSKRFDRVAKFYNTPFFQFYYVWAHKACINFLKEYIKDGFTIADVACGTGIFLKKISTEHSGLKLFGVDNSEGMISIANKIPGSINFKVASAAKLPFENNSLDLVTIIDAFYYFQDKGAILKECSRVLKPGQHLFIFYPAVDLFPKIFLQFLKIISKFLLFNLEEYSSFPKIKELEQMATLADMKLVIKKMKSLNRFLVFKKN
jgi:ubiquinone/menaquinone biosynthesis C-methylase UbiE